ncbi:MAG: 50S ribosomal protein L9 [Armatimonadetes bacterium CG2_30_59_28]|nr:50S ribosomal protein L9 [Armatimonadota bacterium]OIO89537.1 MAG: 50S ribosomal protein L9 [Armatimonadetes bacterium CG2_30_59_28]
MKVILRQSVPKLGQKNEIVSVADGYAHNYLIPRGLAEVATSGAQKQQQNLTKAEKQRDDRMRDQSEITAQKLRETTLVIKARTGPDGRLYGSVTAMDIAERVKDEFKVTVDRRRIGLPEPIKSLGIHSVPVGLLSDLSVDLNVEVIGES